jgi:signal transduction histidine kinase
MIDFFIVVIANTLSLFDTVALLWLGLTVLLTGDRRKAATIAGSAGLLLGAIFFGGHTLIITATSSAGVALVWRIMWIVAVAAPFMWGQSIFYYSGDPSAGRWVRRVLTLAALGLILALFVISPLPSFYEFILAPHLTPVVAWAYVPYLFVCFTLPLIALRRRKMPFTVEGKLIHDRFRHARPWLLGAASMLALAVIAFAFTAYVIVPRAIPMSNLTLNVLREIYVADSVIAGCIALAVVLLGRAVLANNVLIERVQSSQGFFARWRTVVLMLGLASFMIALLYNSPIRPIYSLLLTMTLGVVAYVLFNWRQHVEHQDFLNRLRPFVASLRLGEHLLTADKSDTWGEARELFTALCQDALRAERACLLFDNPATVPASAVTAEEHKGPRRIDYNWSPANDKVLSNAALMPGDWTRLDADHWAWPLSDSNGALGRLILGPKLRGAEYTAQELQVAAACADRILDALAGEQIARLALSLLQQRIAEVQVMSAQHKRVLHDDLLPRIHLALLKIESLRMKPVDHETRIDEIASSLTQTHQRLSALVREMSNAVPTRLESEGAVAALHTALTHDFRDNFDAVEWQAAPEATEQARRLPLFVGEVVFYAAQEAIRNAAKHARGGDPRRKLHLAVAVESAKGLMITIGDDGVGRTRSVDLGMSRGDGSGSGLLFHGAMLAVVGGTLNVSDRPGGGTQVVIDLPRVSDEW